jgi:Holliday junction resolvasome RuvABC ATP-dependent DNA helicase subunit
MTEEMIDGACNLDDIPSELSLRPKLLDEYIGQEELRGT